MTSEYHRPRGMRWQEQPQPRSYPEIAAGWRIALVCVAVLLVAWVLAGCAGPSAELALKGRVFPMDAADCERIAAKTGGVCYAQ